MNISDFERAMAAAGFGEFPDVSQQQMNEQLPSWPEVLGLKNDASAQERRARLKHMCEATGHVPLRQLAEYPPRVYWLSPDGIFVYDADSPSGRNLTQHGGSIRIEDAPLRLLSKGGEG